MFAWLRPRKRLVHQTETGVLALAHAEAIAGDHEYIGTEHLLLALGRMPDSVAWRSLSERGIDLDPLRTAVHRLTQPGAGTPGEDRLPYTPSARAAMDRAERYARQLGHADIGPEHVLLGLLGEPESVAYAILVGLGVRPPELGTAVVRAAGWPAPDGSGPKSD